MRSYLDCIPCYKPELWTNANTIINIYNDNIPRMRKRSCFSTMHYEEKLYALFSHAAYRFTTTHPIEKINEYSLVRELSDDNSVVYTTQAYLGVTTRIILAFRGTNPLNLGDILTDVFITIGKEGGTDRFLQAHRKVEKLIDLFPEIPITVCGHSLGGTQAIAISKKYKFRTYTYNPAQGISLHYLDDIDKHPQIRVLRVLSDPVSCIAGLENVSGTILFPSVSDTNKLKNHSLSNFLPSRQIPENINL